MKDFNDYIIEKNANAMPTIYCDMDGVLADLVGHMGSLYGVTLTNKTFDDFRSSRIAEVDKNHPHLFYDLPYMKGAKDLWRFISKYNVEILSARPRTWQQANAANDKIQWVRDRLSPQPRTIHIVTREEKKKWAVKNGVKNILIDDWKVNIAEWEAAGGIGIKHKTAEQTIARLKELGFK